MQKPGTIENFQLKLHYLVGLLVKSFDFRAELQQLVELSSLEFLSRQYLKKLRLKLLGGNQYLLVVPDLLTYLQLRLVPRLLAKLR